MSVGKHGCKTHHRAPTCDSITLFACCQAEEWASREKREAEALQGRYDSTYSQAETQFQGSRSLLADIQVLASSQGRHNAYILMRDHLCIDSAN